MRLLIALRGGTSFQVDVADFQVEVDGPNQRVRSFRYFNAAEGDLLAAIVPAEIAAVVRLDVPADLPPADDEPDGHRYQPLYGPAREHPSHLGVDCDTYDAARQLEAEVA